MSTNDHLESNPLFQEQKAEQQINTKTIKPTKKQDYFIRVSLKKFVNEKKQPKVDMSILKPPQDDSVKENKANESSEFLLSDLEEQDVDAKLSFDNSNTLDQTTKKYTQNEEDEKYNEFENSDDEIESIISEGKNEFFSHFPKLSLLSKTDPIIRAALNKWDQKLETENVEENKTEENFQTEESNSDLDFILAELNSSTPMNDTGSERLIASISPEESSDEEEVELTSSPPNSEEMVRKAKEEFIKKQIEEEEESERRKQQQNEEIEKLMMMVQHDGNQSDVRQAEAGQSELQQSDLGQSDLEQSDGGQADSSEPEEKRKLDRERRRQERRELREKNQEIATPTVNTVALNVVASSPRVSEESSSVPVDERHLNPVETASLSATDSKPLPPSVNPSHVPNLQVSQPPGISIQGPVNIYLNQQTDEQKFIFKNEYRRRYRRKYRRLKRNLLKKIRKEYNITLELSSSSSDSE